MLALLLVSIVQANGPVISLSGTIQGEQSGAIRLELLSPQGPGKNPLLVWHAWLDRGGTFSLEVPAGLGPVKLRAAVDLKRDGIGPDDPQIRLPISLVVEHADISGLSLLMRPPEYGSPALPGSASPPKGNESKIQTK
jgi:hypothetical protein